MGSRFVVQEHTTPQGIHWDLMIEGRDALMTFRLSEPPENTRGRAVRAVRISDHALRFLSYEGPVQKGTGSVRIVERGTCRLLDAKEDVMLVDLQGALLRGAFTLTRIEGATWELAPQLMKDD